MAWTSPRDWADGEVVTDVHLNTHVRDNLNQTAPAKVTTQGDIVYAAAAASLARLGIGTDGQLLRSGGSAPEYYTPDIQSSYNAGTGTRASATWGDLTGSSAGPSITLAVGPLGIAIVTITCRLSNSTTGGIAVADISVGSGSPDGQEQLGNNNTDDISVSKTRYFTGLSEGSAVFKMEYLSSSGTGTFSRRRIQGLAL